MTKMTFKTAAVVVALAALTAAGCTRRETPAPVTPDPGPSQPTNPTNPTNPTGPVTGGPITPGSVQDFTINIGDRVYFDFDSYSIRSDASRILAAQAGWLARYPQVMVRIEGNADERGTREYNLALGARRAESVRTYLIERGINAGRIDTISFGKERPIAAGSSEESWARNRNAHTAIVSGAAR